MKKTSIYQLSLFVFILLVIAGSALKILHSPLSSIIFNAGVALGLVLMILGILDITANPKLKWYERTMWISAFVLLQPISGLLYMPIYKLRNK